MKTPLTLNFKLETLNPATVFALLLLLGTAFAQTNAPALSPADTLWKQARTTLEAKQYAKAQPLFTDFLKRYQADPRAAEARICVGICDFRQGQTPRALDVWNRTVNMELMQKRVGPGLLLGLEQLSSYYRTEQKLPELNKVLGQMQSLFPNDSVTAREHLLAANARFEAGDFAAAVALYEKAGQLKGTDADNYKTARALASGGQTAASMIASADKNQVENAPAVAARLYEEALKLNPNVNEKHEAMTKLGWCVYLQEDYEKAEKIWRAVVASAPKGDEWRGKSRWHLVVLNAGRYNNDKEAIALCEEQAKEFDGGFLGQQAVFTKAWLLKTAGKWKEAKQGFEQLLAAYPATANCPPVFRYIEECESGMAKDK